VILGLFFGLSALLGLFGLCAVALHDVPRVSGTVVFVLTLAALAVALVR
jgi:hypothetical protein